MQGRVLVPLAFAVSLVMTSALRAGVIDCTQAAFEQAIAQANASGGNVTITFNCSNATIRLDSGRDGNRLITASNVAIDGEGRNIVFEMNPPWWDDSLTACAGGNCDPDGNNIPDACAETEGASMFLNLQGSDIAIRNVAFNYFWDGIHMGRNGGSRQTLDNVSCDDPGDDCVSNPTNTGDRLVIRNSRFSNACDKAVQLYGTDIAGTSNDHFNVEGSTFTNCSAPLRAPYAGGRFRVIGNTFRETNPTAIFRCDGPRFDGTASAVYFSGNTVDGCRRGLRIGGGTHLISSGNFYRNNALRGVAVYGTARASFEGDTFENNGGSTSSETFYGGISVAGTATAIVGGGSITLDGQSRTSLGRNTFLGNRSATDATLDLENQTTTQVRAENNWWGDTDPSDQVTGPVDFAPFLTAPPGGTGDPTPPADVQSLRRTDKRP
jgi:hypothetical protein